MRDDLRDPGFRRAMAVGLTAFVVSRLCVLVGAAVRAAQRVVDVREEIVERTAAGLPILESEPTAGSEISNVLTSWDGRWYLEIIRNGYPDSLPANITYEQLEARAEVTGLQVQPDARALDVHGGGKACAEKIDRLRKGGGIAVVGALAQRVGTQRGDTFLSRRVIDRARRSRWEEKGSLTLGQRAHQEVEKLLENYQSTSLPEDIKKELTKLMTAEARKHGQNSLPVLPE